MFDADTLAEAVSFPDTFVYLNREVISSSMVKGLFSQLNTAHSSVETPCIHGHRVILSVSLFDHWYAYIKLFLYKSNSYSSHKVAE